MCPFCIAAAALVALSATGAGGLTVLAVASIGKKKALSTIPKPANSKEDRHG